MRLEVADDGKGISVDEIVHGGMTGHWGLRGMRERAARIGATFAVHSRAAGGTAVELSLPAATAYLAPVKKPGFLVQALAVFVRLPD